MKFLALSLSALAAVVSGQSDPSFDHQTKTYKASFEPVSVQNEEMTLTPFFSPDHSIDTLVDLIDSAESTVDIETPGVSSWIGCTFGNPCIGCPVDQQSSQETFPVFPALLNAAHRGVKVRLVTNNYNDPVCADKIDILTFFALNGIDIKWYQVRACVRACACMHFVMQKMAMETVPLPCVGTGSV